MRKTFKYLSAALVAFASLALSGCGADSPVYPDKVALSDWKLNSSDKGQIYLISEEERQKAISGIAQYKSAGGEFPQDYFKASPLKKDGVYDLTLNSPVSLDG